MKSLVSSYENYKKRKERETKRVNNYILKNIQTIRNDSTIEIVDTVTEEEVNIILRTIEKELENKENDIIREVVEWEYKKNKLKMFLNKNKYMEKNTEFYKGIFNIVNNYIRKAYNIDNKFGLYYCTFQADDLSKSLLKKHEKQNLSSTLIIFEISYLHKFYSDITKELYILNDNKEELDKIQTYEKIRKNYITEQLDEQSSLTKSLSKNVKTLTRNIK